MESSKETGSAAAASASLGEAREQRRRIILAAARLFCRLGYNRTTVRALAAEVGMQSGNLFYHFKNKDDVLEAVMREGVLLATEAADRALAAAGSTQERLRGLFRAHIQTLLGPDHEALQVMLYEWRRLPQEQHQRLVALRDAYEERWQVVLDAAAKEGLCPPDTRLFRRYLLGALNWSSEWFRASGEIEPSDLADRFLRFALEGRTWTSP
ncbi:MAG: TetR/AcrR family transcriptional regulator [Thermaerobacter sp.]|nr:TetR/AcrR family transcriptional regulator [Thermaerobacter sp.]